MIEQNNEFLRLSPAAQLSQIEEELHLPEDYFSSDAAIDELAQSFLYDSYGIAVRSAHYNLSLLDYSTVYAVFTTDNLLTRQVYDFLLNRYKRTGQVGHRRFLTNLYERGCVGAEFTNPRAASGEPKLSFRTPLEQLVKEFTDFLMTSAYSARCIAFEVLKDIELFYQRACNELLEILLGHVRSQVNSIFRY